jgi:hypothetical protein
MSDSNRNNSGDQSELPATVSQPGNLLDAALAHLPAEQRQALAQKALERKLDIDAKAVEADNRHRASSVDMANTIHQVRALEDSTKSDYTVRAEYETASGRTNIEIKKSNNTVIIVIAIVIAIIVLIMFTK